MRIRQVAEQYFYRVINVLDEWWGGRKMTHLLPRLFFEHFQPTSFVAEDKDEHLAGFLIGFVSQTNPKDAYIHFIGVNPTYRKNGLARELYELFFYTVRRLGCKRVTCITSPINQGSVSFHQSMGFTVNQEKNYAGPGQDQILFSKII